MLQIIPPHDAGIAAAIEANCGLWELPPDISTSKLVRDPLHVVVQRYYYALQQDLAFRPRQDNPKASPVVYTPLHGVGLPWVQKVCMLHVAVQHIVSWQCFQTCILLLHRSDMWPVRLCLVTCGQGSKECLLLLDCMVLVLAVHP